MSTSKKNNVGFRLVKIVTEQFATFEDNFDTNKDIDLKTTIAFGKSILDKAIQVKVEFVFHQKNNELFLIGVSCHFISDNSLWNQFTVDNKNIRIPNSIATHMAVITVGTTRGVLHAKTENSVFNQFHLPTIDLTKIIKGDPIISLE